MRERFKNMLIVKNLNLIKENKRLKRIIKNTPTLDEYKKRIWELELELRDEKNKNKN